MYAGVPSAKPADVSVPGLRRSAFAMPKSATTDVPRADQHVLRLDVAVHDAVLVREGERVRVRRAAARTTSAIGSGPSRAIRARSVSPLTNGIV